MRLVPAERGLRGRLWGCRASLAILAWLAFALPAAAALTPVTPARDFAADARLMLRERVPVLVLFSRADCTWCEKVRREYLAPMERDPAWRARVLVRQVETDSDAPLTDFAGRATSHRRFAAGWKARFTPTVMVLGPDGAQLAEPIVGFRLADFYGAYLEQAIEAGIAKLRPN